eukprot:TRINITY_DN22292_c0_g1_i1.p1 TRINITY_DN22292_c0_g1~~TRINITY_DN22292_c0_g1_i1.p1  ORF type:complete len:639 (-),score=105.53 TRINITY_DN22292_c0_g1_i1:229-2145(-)
MTSAAAFQGSAINDAVEALVEMLGRTLSTPSNQVNGDELFKRLTYAEGALESRRTSIDTMTNGTIAGNPALARVTSSVCSWLGGHEDFSDQLCTRSLLKILIRTISEEEQGNDVLAIQKGILSSVTATLKSSASDPMIAKSCLELLAMLSVVENSDQALNRLGIIPVMLNLLQLYKENISLLDDTITTLALMAKRTRHRNAIKQAKGLTPILDVLKTGMGIPQLSLAVCRFIKNFAVKPELAGLVLSNGGVDALMAAFDTAVRAATTSKIAAQVPGTVASAMCVCAVDCVDIQSTIVLSGWLSSLLAAMQAFPADAELYEGGIGIIRGLAKNPEQGTQIVDMGYVAVALQAMSGFSGNVIVKKEACGFFGNLAAHPAIRVQLGESGVIGPILEVLKNCETNDDRKVAKLALGAISNLASSEENRCLLADMHAAIVILDAARVFMGSENILEYAIGAISHIGVHHECNRQLLEAGAIEALLLFLGQHHGDRELVSKAVVGLRRLLKNNAETQGEGGQLQVLRRIAQAGNTPGSVQGIKIIVDAVDAHLYDEAITKETACLLTSLSRDPSLLPSLLAVAAKKCMEAMDLHKNDAAVFDALAGFLERLPLEDDSQLAADALGAATDDAYPGALAEAHVQEC